MADRGDVVRVLAEHGIDVADLMRHADDLVERLRAADQTPGIAVGERAPLFELPDATGRRVSLQDRLARGPVVLSFYRGGWCPICNTELRDLQTVLPKIRSLGASLLAVSPQAPDGSLDLVDRLDLGFSVLSDLDQSVTRDYRLQFELTGPLREAYPHLGMAVDQHNADGTWNLPVPATFVIDTDGIVRARYVDPDYRKRMSGDEVIAALSAL